MPLILPQYSATFTLSCLLDLTRSQKLYSISALFRLPALLLTDLFFVNIASLINFFYKNEQNCLNWWIVIMDEKNKILIFGGKLDVNWPTVLYRLPALLLTDLILNSYFDDSKRNC